MSAKKKVTEFTYSRLMSFLECERKEYFSYQAGGCGIKTIDVQDYFVEGEFGHYALMYWYKSKRMLRDNMSKRVTKAIDKLGEITPELDDKLRMKLTAMTGACQAYKEQYKSDHTKYEILLVEEPFEIEITPSIVWRGKIDLVVKEKETGLVILIDHKFMQAIGNMSATLPLNPQQMVYYKGVEKILGKAPDAYMWNIIKKSGLRRKKTKDGGLEPWLQFEVRVQQQYKDEPEKMFYRTQPCKFEKKVIDNAWEDMLTHVEIYDHLVEAQKEHGMPPMRFSGCTGMFGTACAYGPACLANLNGKGKEGWDAPECKGLYKVKEVQHEELDDTLDDDE